MSQYSSGVAEAVTTTTTNTNEPGATNVINNSKLELQRLNQQYDHLGIIENVFLEELHNLKQEEDSLRKALLQCKETGREQIAREKTTKLQDEALKNLHDVLMANDSDDDNDASSSSSSSSSGIMLHIGDSFVHE